MKKSFKQQENKGKLDIKYLIFDTIYKTLLNLKMYIY